MTQLSASFAYNSPVRTMRRLPSTWRFVAAITVMAFVVAAAVIVNGDFSPSRSILLGIAAFSAAWSAATFVEAAGRPSIGNAVLTGCIAALVALLCASASTTRDERGQTVVAAIAVGISVLVWVSAVLTNVRTAGYDATIGPLALITAAVGLSLLPTALDTNIASDASGLVLATIAPLVAALLVSRHSRRALILLGLLALISTVLVRKPDNVSYWTIVGSILVLGLVAETHAPANRGRALLTFTGVDAVLVAVITAFLGIYLAFSISEPVRGFQMGALAVLAIAVALFQRSMIAQRESRMSDLARQNARIRAFARLDPLTGLPNRAALDARLAEEVERSVRYGQPLSVLFVDIDHFKAINDTRGHQVGDEVLQSMASVLRSTVRTPDFVARYGGEEFVIVAPGTWTADGAVLGGRIQDAVARQAPQPLGGPITVSIGIAGVPEHGRDPSVVLRIADLALYAAKNGGRNRVEIGITDPASLSP
jgi:diguanylate cyclase (GGDEF)-like protein